MCDPITVGVLVAGGAMQAYGKYKEGVAESKYYTYQQDQARQSAELALRQGDAQSTAIQNTAKQEGKQLALNQAEFNASQRAQMAANGLTGVTAEDITNDTFSKEKLDELVLRNNADLKSWEVNEEAKNRNWALNTEAGQYGLASKNAKSAGKRNAFSTLLNTATSVATYRKSY